MLVLARKTTQRILIGDDIEIVILKIGENIVSVGVEAPREMRILRAEIDDDSPEKKAA